MGRGVPAGRTHGVVPPMSAVLVVLAAWTALPALPVHAQGGAAMADPVAIGELLRNAQLWQRLGRADNVRLVLNKILAIDGGQAQALLLLGELELREGRSTQAQGLLARLQRGSDAAATAELQDLVRVYTRDLPRLQQLRLLRRGGNEARAATLARELFPAGRAPGALADEFGGLLRGGERAAARPGRPGSTSAAAAPRPGTRVPPAAAAPPTEDRYWPLLREARALRDAGRLDEARGRVAAAQALQPGEAEGRLLGADLDARLGRSAAAEAAYRALLDDPAAAGVHGRAAPRLVTLLQAAGRQEDALAAARGAAADALDAGALRQAADAELAQGRPGGALRLLEAALAVRPRDPWLRHDLARLYGRLGQVGLARDVLAEGLSAAPADAEQAYAAALAYAALDLDAEALSALDAVPEAARSDSQRALAQRLRDARAQAEARRSAAATAAVVEAARRRVERDAWRQPTDEVALFPYARRAADGRSSLRGLELPIVLTRPDAGLGDADDAGGVALARPQGHRWLHVDPVRIDAGALPAAFDEASEFGTVRAGGQPLPAPLPQRARGLNLGVGWTGNERRWDLGVVGAGFEVPNLVGGWRQAFTLRGQDASVELSRRVLTGGLLPYAGTRDPLSGRRWGGVTLSAASLRVAGDLAGWASSASLRVGLLGGKNVAGNDTTQLRLATDRDWIAGPALRLNAGATFSLWRYRRNLGLHTFGHGGYYSPQRYTSLSLPVDAQGRLGAWSYHVRASVGRSWTFEADAPYYPTDPALQAAAGDLMHAGGRGGGTSTSLRAELERRLGPHWSAGASVFADRSAYYAPTQWLFYLRRSLVPQTGEVPLPRPVQPYSQF